jgi:hypothetical protein
MDAEAGFGWLPSERRLRTWSREGKRHGSSLGPTRSINIWHLACVGLTPRWSGRVIDKVPSPNVGVRAAQLNR